MNRARQIRLDRGLTIAAVADATGVSRRAISRLEDAVADTQAPTLKALGDYYGVPASTLLLPAVEAEATA